MEERDLNHVGRITELLHHTLPEDYEYNFIDKHNDPEEMFRMKLSTISEVKKWLNDLEQKSRTTWRVLQTFPGNDSVHLFRKYYRCHHNTDKRTSGAKSSKNTNCEAKVKIAVKRYIENTTEEYVDPLIKEWPCVIRLNNKHNHSLESASVLKHRAMSEETKHKLLNLFDQGHSPSSALKCLKTDLYLEHPEDYALLEGDGRYVPSLSICGHLFTKEFKQQHGSRDGEQMLKDLKGFLEEYSTATGGKAISGTTDDGHTYVCICTRLMTRAHAMIKQSSEVVYVDAVSGMGRYRYRVYFLTTSTPAGCIPLGVIICDAEKEALFERALKDLIESCLPEKPFHGQTYPGVIITDIDWKERTPLQAHFASSTQLLCQFHVLKAMWSWLCKTTKPGIEKSDCQELFYQFKSMVYSRSEEELHMTYRQLICKNPVAKKYPPFIKYVQKSWEEKEAWASCYRSGIPLWGNSRYAEVAFRISKDSILEKIVGFNVAQLADFFLTRYETYIEKQLLSFSQGRLQKSLLCARSAVPLDGISEYESETRSDCFTVPSESEENVSYTVDISTCTCECPHGNASSMCKHISAVFEKLKRDSICFAGESTLMSKITMFQIATGEEPSPEWLMPRTAEVPTEQDHPQVQHIEVAPSQGNLRTYVELFLAVPEGKENSRNHLSSDQASIKEHVKEEVNRLFDRVMRGIEKNPDVFIPAVTQMARNVKKHASTEAGLAASLHTFAENPLMPPSSKNSQVASIKQNTETQPSSKKCRVASIKQNTGTQPSSKKSRVASIKQNNVTHRYRPIAPKPREKKPEDHDYTV